MLDNPVNDSPLFKRAWDRARGIARDRRATREHIAIAEIAANHGQPGALVKKLIQNDITTADNLMVVRRVVGPEAFEEVRSEYVRHLLDAEERAPGGLMRELQSMDREAVQILLPGRSRRVLQQTAQRYSDLTASGIPRAIATQTELRPFIKEVIDNPSSAGIDALYKLMQNHGGMNGSFGGSIRSSIIDELIERSTTKGRAGGMSALEGLGPVAQGAVDDITRFDRINGASLNKELKKFKDAGLLRFLRPDDLRKLQDVESIQLLMDAASKQDVSALLGATTVSKVSKLSTDALATMVHFLGVSRILLSDTARKVLIGSGRAQRAGFDTSEIQLIGAMFASLTSDVRGGEEVPELEHLMDASQEARQ